MDDNWLWFQWFFTLVVVCHQPQKFPSVRSFSPLVISQLFFCFQTPKVTISSIRFQASLSAYLSTQKRHAIWSLFQSFMTPIQR